MSGERLPSLCYAVPCFELFMTAWEVLAKGNPRFEPFIAVGLEWATKYYERMDNTRAYVVAMCKFTSIELITYILTFNCA
jgi:hypothetical protein